jgi:hypothetical protein
MIVLVMIGAEVLGHGNLDKSRAGALVHDFHVPMWFAKQPNTYNCVVQYFVTTIRIYLLTTN